MRPCNPNDGEVIDEAVHDALEDRYIERGDPLQIAYLAVYGIEVYAILVLTGIRISHDDGSGYGKLVRQRNVYKRLEQIGPDFGYFPAGAKCWLTVPKRMEQEVKQYLADNGLPWQVTQGKRYVGGFIGSEDALSEWIEPKVEDWTFAIERLANAAVRYPPDGIHRLNALTPMRMAVHL
ncbi:hypothetical protein THAOC_23994, partial [Thalassiosira oceanica]